MQTTSILVVEDDAGLREALCDTLSLANYQVVPAQSAEQGLQLLKQHKISLFFIKLIFFFNLVTFKS